MFDSFENPVQAAFTLQTSKKYSISILPHLGGDFKFTGDAESAFKNLIVGNPVNASLIKSADGMNHISASVNTYLLMFRMFYTAEYQREIGISLQLRNQGNFSLSNTALAIPYSYKFLQPGVYYNSYINNHKNMAFWQLGLSYRENYNAKLAFGAKLSYLSGAVYSHMDINRSRILMEPRTFNVQMAGAYTSSFGTDGLSAQSLIPGFKNPGFALSLGTSYTFKNKLYLTAHLKDAGIIFWNKKTPQYVFVDQFDIKKNEQRPYKDLFYNAFHDMIKDSETPSGSFYELLDSPIEFALSKRYNQFKPVIVVSKNLSNSGGFLALQNNYTYRSLNVSLNASYHLHKNFNIGGLLMLKSDNAEFLIGTEKLIPSYKVASGYLSKNEDKISNPIQSDVFMGLNIKFGRRVQTMGYADFVDGLNDKETGYVYRLSKKEKGTIKKSQPKKGIKRKN